MRKCFANGVMTVWSNFIWTVQIAKLICFTRKMQVWFSLWLFTFVSFGV